MSMSYVMRLLVILLTLVLTATATASICPDRHAIDIELDTALAQDLSTADALAAIAAAHDRWDEQLNRHYRILMDELPEAARAELRESQRAWLRFRDREQQALTVLYEHTEGSVFRPMHALDRLRLVKDRVQHLSGWIDVWRLQNQ